MFPIFQIGYLADSGGSRSFMGQIPPSRGCYWTQVPVPDEQWSQTETLEFAAEKCLLQGQSRKTSGLCSKTLNSFMVFEEFLIGEIWGEGCRACRGLHSLLTGWWWGNRVVFQKRSAQPCYHPPPGWALVPQKNSEILLCIFLVEEPGLCPKVALLFPDSSSLVSAFPPFPD